MKFKAALFDLDGTLLDTEPVYEEASQKVINEFGNGAHYDWDVREKVVGAPEMVGAKVMTEAYQMRLTPEEYLKERNIRLWDGFAVCKPMPGAKEITHKLKHEYGLKVAVATSSWKESFDQKLKSHHEWFKEDVDVCITGDDKRITKGKPDPDIFLVAAKELGVDPSECIVFEDAITGVKAGLATGAPVVVGVPYPYFRKQMEELPRDESKTKLVILDSLADFDYSMLN